MSQKSYDGKASLYLVPTPIGNLEDITLRAINILNEVNIIFAEDTRVTGNLLNHLKIKKKIISAHEHNEEQAKGKMLEYLNNNQSVALVTDRGTPIISDPGFRLTSYAIENGYNVIGLPGPTAFVPAIIVSGLLPYPFIFYGFLNSKTTKKKRELNNLKKLTYTIIFYEAPHRLKSTLEIMKETFGNRKISISREISKKFEEVYRGTIDEVIEEIIEPKGEIVIVVEGNKEKTIFNDLTPLEQVNLYIKDGCTEKEAIKLTAKEKEIEKNELYKQYHAGK